MVKPMILPEHGQVIHMGSVWADYCKGLVSAECVSWAYLVGMDVFGDLSRNSDLIAYDSVVADIDDYSDKLGLDGLISYLSKSPVEFRDWWCTQIVLNNPDELYDSTCMFDKGGLSACVLAKVSGLIRKNIILMLTETN